MGKPTGEKNTQEASSTRPLCSIFSQNFHEGTAKPVHQTTKSTASSKQTEVTQELLFSLKHFATMNVVYVDKDNWPQMLLTTDVLTSMLSSINLN